MKPKRFGRTGLYVSPLCLGTMTMGFQTEEAASIEILDTAFDAGITFIDTADAYPPGHHGDLGGATEEIIGRWMAKPGRRESVILATKFFYPMGANPWDQGGSRKHILDAVEASLRRLDTDYLDLYQIHAFDPHTPLDETLGALDDVVRSGKVRYVGCSNYAAWQLARAIGRSEARDLCRFESVQPRYNLLFRNIERELLPLSAHDDIAVIPYNPLAGGLLTGKHRDVSAPESGGRFELGTSAERYRDRYWHDDNFTIVEQLSALAEEAGMSMVTMAIAWTMANPGITAPIIGASKASQLTDAIAAASITLDDDLYGRLNEITNHYRLVDAER